MSYTYILQKGQNQLKRSLSLRGNVKKKVFAFSILVLFFFFQATAQREFGLSLQNGLSETSVGFWLWLSVLIFLSLVAKPISHTAWLWRWTQLPLSFLDLNFAIRENIRALGSILSYGLILILPGFYRYLQLYWVTWIALVDTS